jgi:two-component system phosphate regulon response regulator PhoB
MSPATVLIVEDEPGTANMYRIVLEVEGYRALVAYTASAALKAIEREKPDLMLLDVVLRGSSGLDLCRQVRRDPETADLPVVIVSVRGDEEDLQAGFEAGANAYLVKPISQEELLQTVRDTLAEEG